MRVHLIKNGVVNNTIVIESLALAVTLYPDTTCIEANEGGVGWLWDGEKFSPPPPPPLVVPEIVSRAQGKSALISSGLWSSVASYVSSISDPTQKALAEVALNDTQEWRRDSQFLNNAASALGMSNSELDSLFISASKVTF